MRTIYFFPLIFLFYSCATQRTPTGGAKDETPPVVTMAIPSPMTTRFAAPRVEIIFDEYVKLQNVRDQVLISPPLTNAPAITLKAGKRLIIDLSKETLRENTTYTINLGEAISDNNEGNILLENVYLFSTGSYIDTLELRGRLLNARYNDPCANCLAMLFPDGADSTVLGQRPYYVGRTDAQGDFHMTNMAPGEYRIFGLKDLDADLKIDKNEALAFYEGLVQPVAKDTVGITLRMSSPEQDFKGIKDKKWSEDGRSLLLVTTGVDSIPKIPTGLQDRLQFIDRLDGRNDSLRYWFGQSLEDISELILDLDGVPDTISVGKSRTILPARPAELTADIPHVEAPLEIMLSRPYQSFDPRGIHLFKDSVPVDFTAVAPEIAGAKILLKGDWVEGAYYNVIFDAGAISDVYGLANDSAEMRVRCPEEKTFGVLSLGITLPDTLAMCGVQLLDKSKKVIHATRADSSFTWRLAHLKPGDYTLRVFVDEDLDLNWTTGDLTARRQPEPVFVLSPPITVRSNWEVEQEVTIDFKGIPTQ